MRLYLAQHGKALDSDRDPQRSLSDAGKADVSVVAQQLGKAGVRVARVWHSGKLRAEQTATVLAAHLLETGAAEATTGIAPNDPVEDFSVDLDVWQEDTLVVGHLPFMARLVSKLVTRNADRFCVQYTPGTVVCLERLSPDQWIIAWMLSPELLEAGGDS